MQYRKSYEITGMRADAAQVCYMIRAQVRSSLTGTAVALRPFPVLLQGD